jgi:hypothetical protein
MTGGVIRAGDRVDLRPYILALPAWSTPESGHNNTANYRGGTDMRGVSSATAIVRRRRKRANLIGNA